MFAYYGLYNSSCSQYQRCKSPSSMLKVLWDTISILLSNALHLFLRTAHVVWRKNAVFSTKECFKDGILYLSSKPFCVIVLIAQSCLTLCSPTDCSSPGSSVHGILQAGILEGLPCPPPGHLPDPRIEPSPLHCRQILYHSVESIACHVDPTPEGSFMCMWAHKSSTSGSSPWESCCGPFPKSLLLLKHPILLPELFPPLILSGLQGRPDSGITSFLKPSCPCSFQGNHPSSH